MRPQGSNESYPEREARAAVPAPRWADPWAGARSRVRLRRRADRLDRLHARGLQRGVDSVENTEDDGDADREDEARDLDRKTRREEARAQLRDSDTAGRAEKAPDDRQDQRRD